MTVPGFITEAEQAKRIGKTIRTLQLWRKQGIGPAWTKAGNTVLYGENSAADWLKANEQTPVRERRKHGPRRERAENRPA
jgi:hypothetical protein